MNAAGNRSAYGSSRSRIVGSVSGSGASGIGYWCSGPASATWNDARQVEDRPAVLDRDDAAGREAAAVADAVDVVDDRDARIAGPQEVRVQRMHVPVGVDGSPRRDQRLPRDLTAEHALTILVGAHAAEQVHLELLELEQVDEIVERAHPSSAQNATGCAFRSAEEDGGGCEELVVDRLESVDALCDRDAHDVGAAERDHHLPKSPSCTASIASMPKRVAITRSYAVGLPPRSTCPSDVMRASYPVRRSISLGQARADAAEPHVAELVDLARLQLHRAFLGRRAFGRDDDREVGAALVPVREPVADLLDVERLLRE